MRLVTLSIFFIIYFIREKSLVWIFFVPFILMPFLFLVGYLGAIILLDTPISLLFLIAILIVIIKDYYKDVQILPEKTVFFYIIFLLLWIAMRIFDFYLINEFSVGIIGLPSIIFAYIALKKHFSIKIKNIFISIMIVTIIVPSSIFVFFSSLSTVFISSPFSVDEITEKVKEGNLIIEKHAVDHGALASTSYYTRTRRR